jgi:hypothetical protein
MMFTYQLFNQETQKQDFNPSGNPSFGFFKAKEPNQCLVICSDSKSSAQQVLSIVLYKISYCPEDHGDFILDTDACDSSIGAVLSQIQDGRLRVIAYGSRTLNKATLHQHCHV